MQVEIKVRIQAEKDKAERLESIQYIIGCGQKDLQELREVIGNQNIADAQKMLSAVFLDYLNDPQMRGPQELDLPEIIHGLFTKAKRGEIPQDDINLFIQSLVPATRSARQISSDPDKLEKMIKVVEEIVLAPFHPRTSPQRNSIDSLVEAINRR